MSEANRSRSLWPLPGGVEGYFDTALDLLDFVRSERPNEEQLLDRLRTKYNVTGGRSTLGYVAILKRLGLIERQGNSLALARHGKEWLETQDRRLAYRQLAARFEGVQDVLDLVAESPRSLQELQDALNKRLGAGWKTRNQTFFRTCWLRSLGVLQLDDDGKFRLTTTGREFAGQVQAPPPPPAAVAPPSVDTHQPPLDDEAHRLAEALCTRLDRAAVAGGDGKSFEQIVAEAFRFLGFEAMHVGGSSNADVVLDARRGVEPVRLVVDAKSCSRGTVPDAQIDWDSIDDHRRRHEAQGAVIVGASFAGGNLEKRARDRRVTLLRVDQLQAMLRAHASSPLDFTDHLDLLVPGEGKIEDEQLVQFAERAEAAERWPLVLADVFRTIWERQSERRARVDENALFFLLDEEHDTADIRQAVELLKGAAVHAIDVGSDGRLQTRCSPSTLATRLRRLADRLEAPSEADDEAEE